MSVGYLSHKKQDYNIGKESQKRVKNSITDNFIGRVQFVRTNSLYIRGYDRREISVKKTYTYIIDESYSVTQPVE